LFEADHHARRLGLPLNWLLTIRWSLTSTGETDANKRFAKLRYGMADWLRRRGIPLTAIHVWENPVDAGLHVHAVIHCPPALRQELECQLSMWVGPARPRAIDLRPRRHSSRWRGGVIAYVTKGTDAVTAARAGGRAKQQGVVLWKRYGITENLAAKARKAWENAARNGK
jgi:hypothetical protein